MTALTTSLRQALSVGIPQIDEEHQQLFDYLDGLLLSVNTRYGQSRALEMLSLLELYAATHFKSEETLMENHAYPDAEKHKKEHQAFIQRLQEFRAQLGNIGQPMTAFIIEWLTQHIQLSDAALAKFIKAQA